MFRKLLVAAFLIAPALNACAYAQSSQAPKWTELRPAPGNYGAAPADLQSFFLKAKEADEIADPLQRCLAFPDLPGTQWPKGLAEQHCQLLFGLSLRFEDIKARVDARDVAWLEETYRALLERHFSKRDFSEHIHGAFALVRDARESDRVTARWLALAPNSPYAMTARAEYLRRKGWEARDGEVAANTSDERMAQMQKLHEQAATLYRRALQIEPRMMPAYAGLVNMARSGAIDVGDAFEEGRKIDPGCQELMAAQMVRLQPRWGGSWEKMQALEKEMLPQLAERPLLALPRSYPYHDMADMALRAGDPGSGLPAVQPAIANSTNPFLLEDAANAMAAQNKREYGWTMLAYSVASTRYHHTPDCGCPARIANSAELRGMLFTALPHDMEAANEAFAFEVKTEPDNPAAHYHYAESFVQLHQAAEAEREFLLAEKLEPDVAKKATTVNAVLLVLELSGQYDKAIALTKRQIKDYPKHASGWFRLAEALRNSGAPVAKQHEALKNFLRGVDRNDPSKAQEIAWAEKMLQEP